MTQNWKESTIKIGSTEVLFINELKFDHLKLHKNMNNKQLKCLKHCM